LKLGAHDEWLEAREEPLAKEKELTRLLDALGRERRELPSEAGGRSAGYVLEARDFVGREVTRAREPRLPRQS
jgi:predicted dithiol-disulfide oxidoreductase (DUF899 family)